jgi:hypothetical protein
MEKLGILVRVFGELDGTRAAHARRGSAVDPGDDARDEGRERPGDGST